MNHTPGPWRVDKEMDGYPSGRLTRIFDDRNKQIASTYNQTRARLQESFEQAEANARLIAAAPDMYEALIAMLNPDESERDVDMALAALHKAEGRTT